MVLPIVSSLIIFAATPSEEWKALLADEIVMDKISDFKDGDIRLSNGLTFEHFSTNCEIGEHVQVAIFRKPSTSLMLKYRKASLIYCGNADLAQSVREIGKTVRRHISDSPWPELRVRKAILSNDASAIYDLPSKQLKGFLSGLRNLKNNDIPFRTIKPHSNYMQTTYSNAIHYTYDALLFRFSLPELDYERFSDKEFRIRVINALYAAAISEENGMKK